MKRTSVLGALVLLALLWLATSAFAQTTKPKKQKSAGSQPQRTADLKPLTAKEIFARWKSAVYTIETDRGVTGTGFATSTDALLTCYHIVEGATRITASLPGAKPVQITHAYNAHKDLDVAGFYIPGFAGKPVRLGFGASLSIGDPLYVIGSPEGLEQTLTEGILSGRRTQGGLTYLQLSAAISPGSSGSPVFDRFGQVVGIVVAFLKEGQQLNFALSIDSLLLRPIGVPIDTVFGGKTDSKAAANLDQIFDTQGTGLRWAPDFSIMIESLPPKLPKSISIDDVQRWIKSDLADAAPRARVIEKEEQAKKTTDDSAAGSIDEYLRGMDDAGRRLDISIYYYPAEDTAHSRTYSVYLTFERPGITRGGARLFAAWSKDASGNCDTDADVESRLRSTLRDLVKQFGEDWSRENPEK